MGISQYIPTLRYIPGYTILSTNPAQLHDLSPRARARARPRARRQIVQLCRVCRQPADPTGSAGSVYRDNDPQDSNAVLGITVKGPSRESKALPGRAAYTMLQNTESATHTRNRQRGAAKGAKAAIYLDYGMSRKIQCR